MKLLPSLLFLLVFASTASATEACFPSLETARAVHPTAWLSWTDRQGNGRRYYVGKPRRHVKCDPEVREARIPLSPDRKTRDPENRTMDISRSGMAVCRNGDRRCIYNRGLRDEGRADPARRIAGNADRIVGRAGVDKLHGRAETAVDTARCPPEQGQALADELLPLSMIGKRMLIAEMAKEESKP